MEGDKKNIFTEVIRFLAEQRLISTDEQAKMLEMLRKLS